MRKRLSFQYAIEAIVLLLVATCFILLARVAYHDRNLSKSLYADGGDEALALHSELCQLDKVIAGKQAFLQARQHVIDSLKGMIPALPVAQHMGVYRKIHLTYSDFQADSALRYVDKIIQLARKRTDSCMLNYAYSRRALTLAFMGDYEGAKRQLETVDVARLGEQEYTEYMHICRTIYGWEADYLNNIGLDNTESLRRTALYRDSILHIERDSLSRCIVLADKMIVENKIDSAESMLLPLQEHVSGTQLSYTLYNLAEVYRMRGQTDKQMQVLARTVINDLKNGVAEYTALPHLSHLLCKRGDILRAYSYLHCSMEDASSSNAMLRSVQINKIFPIIDQAYQNVTTRKDNREKALIGALATLVIIILVITLSLWREARKLRQTRSELADTNQQLALSYQQLEDINRRLNDASRLKEDYIAIYLTRCRQYIDILDTFHRSLLKIAKTGHQEELLNRLKTDTTVADAQQQLCKDFDNAFLNIHPQFVERFNALLKPEAQLRPKKGEHMNTELRIFALMRLGVDDMGQIARILNYSMTTVYNYSSRVRNNSLYEKEEFRRRLKEL